MPVVDFGRKYFVDKRNAFNSCQRWVAKVGVFESFFVAARCHISPHQCVQFVSFQFSDQPPPPFFSSPLQLLFTHTTVTHRHVTFSHIHTHKHTHAHNVAYNFSTNKEMSKPTNQNGIHLGHRQIGTQINMHVRDQMIHCASLCHSKL